MIFSECWKAEAVEDLKKILKPGGTLYYIRNGNYISFYCIKGNQPRWMDRLIAKATGIQYSEKQQALTLKGQGYNRAQDVCYQLRQACFPRTKKYFTYEAL